jgi:YD repeat-containing protein
LFFDNSSVGRRRRDGPADNLMKTIDDAGDTTQQQYDPDGRVTDSIDGDNETA